MAISLPDEVRASCALIAENARSVTIDLEALEGARSRPGARSRHRAASARRPAGGRRRLLPHARHDQLRVRLVPSLHKRLDHEGRPVSGYFTVAWSLADRFRGVGPWTNAELRTLRTEEVADTLGQDRDHELMALYAQALRDLGRFLGERHALDLVARVAAARPP